MEVQFSLVIHLCPTLCDPMDCSTLSFPVHYQLSDLAQAYVYQVCDAIQPSSVAPFSSCLQSFLGSGSFPMSWFFALGGQSIGISASASVLLMNIQDWFPLGCTGWISLKSKGLSRVFANTKASILWQSAFFRVQLSHPYMKTITLTRQTFVGKVVFLFFSMLSRLIITFLPRSKCLLISWLQSPSAVI